MENIPDILTEIYNNLPAHRSNIDELQSIWNDYLHLLKTQFPEISIDHDGDTVCLGELSPGCLLCKNGEWDCSFITPACNLNCEFCISPFVSHSHIPISAYGKTIEGMITNYKKIGIKGISFSGGEPFLNFMEILTRLQTLKQALPDTYYWLYTNGMLVTKAQIDILADSGIDEIRYNTAATGYNDKKILRIMEYSAQKIANVTVEIPLILRDKETLGSAIPDYSSAGVQYLNLHELMKEDNTPSQQLNNENFKKFIFEDGHATEISLDSKFLINEIISKMTESKIEISLNFCSTINKLRQIRKRRANMIQLLKNSHEKIMEEEYLETVFIFQDRDAYQFIHPDLWQSDQTNYKNYSAIRLKKIAPLAVFDRARYISAQKL
ncbi:MAG: radical SAM protein [bacterium]|nr:radical SAM protein [bacterium]